MIILFFYSPFRETEPQKADENVPLLSAIHSFTKKQLVPLLKVRSLKITGARDAMINRLVDYENGKTTMYVYYFRCIYC